MTHSYNYNKAEINSGSQEHKTKHARSTVEHVKGPVQLRTIRRWHLGPHS